MSDMTKLSLYRDCCKLAEGLNLEIEDNEHSGFGINGVNYNSLRKLNMVLWAIKWDREAREEETRVDDYGQQERWL